MTETRGVIERPTRSGGAKRAAKMRNLHAVCDEAGAPKADALVTRLRWMAGTIAAQRLKIEQLEQTVASGAAAAPDPDPGAVAEAWLSGCEPMVGPVEHGGDLEVEIHDVCPDAGHGSHWPD